MYKKYGLLLSLAACVSPAYADVLVILPESGVMARAADSIKRGFISAYSASSSKQKLIFVDSERHSMANILKHTVNKKTQLIVGPLERSDIETLMQLAPKVPVLALNDVNKQSANVWQFSLAKQHDVDALSQVLQEDRIKKLLLLRQTGMEESTERYVMLLMSAFGSDIEFVASVPKKLASNDGLLLLGSTEWLAQLGKLPEKHIYATSLSIEQGQTVPRGLIFCDVPALYNGQWPDMLQAYQQQPENMAFQRLLAFGGDAWSISQQLLSNPKTTQFDFMGRTGQIELKNSQIQRQPSCYQQQKKGIQPLN